MPRFRIRDLQGLTASPTSPGALRAKIGDLLVNSVSAAARVEMVNRETGEYRISLQGVLDEEPSRPER